MAEPTTHIGRCPRCTRPLGPRDVIIEYERGGDRARYAACPDCADVVRPR
ncbi:MAG: hypothetical protein ACOC0X_02500 [Halobacteriota archaeon]